MATRCWVMSHKLLCSNMLKGHLYLSLCKKTVLSWLHSNSGLMPCFGDRVRVCVHARVCMRVSVCMCVSIKEVRMYFN